MMTEEELNFELMNRRFYEREREKREIKTQLNNLYGIKSENHMFKDKKGEQR